jgi:hypothetical protein
VAAAQERWRDQVEHRHQDTKPSRELAAYVGRYEHPAYGTVEVALENGGLVWKWNSFRGPLQHFHFDTFLLGVERLQHPLITFRLDRDGEVAAMKVPDMMDVEFARRKQK